MSVSVPCFDDALKLERKRVAECWHLEGLQLEQRMIEQPVVCFVANRMMVGMYCGKDWKRDAEGVFGLTGGLTGGLRKKAMWGKDRLFHLEGAEAVAQKGRHQWASGRTWRECRNLGGGGGERGPETIRSGMLLGAYLFRLEN